MVFEAEREVELKLGLDEPDDIDSLRTRVAKNLHCSVDAIPALEIRRRSIDARRGRVNFQVVVGQIRDPGILRGAPLREVATDGGAARIVVVGDGPTGLFCAYELARAGIASVVLDRGKEVQPRRHDLKGLNRDGRVDPDSNYCFGEGGAGTYSDGKLYTRAHKRGDVRDVLELLALHGAPSEILVAARPHIGSNKLPKVVSMMRQKLSDVGVSFRFGAKVTDLLRDGTRTIGVCLDDGSTVTGDAVVLATGHSARDIFEMLAHQRVALEPKPFAIGVRIEHPQRLINEIQYGKVAGHPKLPAASYRLANTVDDRGVFSFCMCPGGFIVPASTEKDGLVVNGMSLSRRDSRFANSGLVVSVEPQDVAGAAVAQDAGIMGGISVQRAIERAAFRAGGETLRAPATRLTDFLQGRASTSVPDTSYQPGLVPGDISEVLDASGLPLSQKLRQAFEAFNQTMRGYITEEAVLVATESRTSAPLRVLRDRESLQSPSSPGLYPAGEGAGYAGGIVSAAMDGIRVARAIAARHPDSSP